MIVTDYLSSTYFKEKISKTPMFGIEWNPEDIDEWIFEVLRKIGISDQHVIKDITVKTDQGRVKLPSSLVKLIKIYDPTYIQDLEEVFSSQEVGLFQYKINGNHIIVREEQEELGITYYSELIDEEGLPLIPNNDYYIEAVLSYIRFMLGTKAYYTKKISINELQLLEQNWLIKLPAVQGENKKLYNKRFKSIHNRHTL